MFSENPGKPWFGKLLSIITHGINDAYMASFPWRLLACLNKHAPKLTELGAQDSVEIVLVEWRSDVHLVCAATF